MSSVASSQEGILLCEIDLLQVSKLLQRAAHMLEFCHGCAVIISLQHHSTSTQQNKIMSVLRAFTCAHSHRVHLHGHSRTHTGASQQKWIDPSHRIHKFTWHVTLCGPWSHLLAGDLTLQSVYSRSSSSLKLATASTTMPFRPTGP